jgi:hypothetical protein
MKILLGALNPMIREIAQPNVSPTIDETTDVWFDLEAASDKWHWPHSRDAYQ